MFALSVWVLCLLSIVRISEASSNITSKFFLFDDNPMFRDDSFGGPRKPRFLSFQKNKEDFDVRMELSVPFITIPIKKAVDSTSGMMHKLQRPALKVGGLALFAATIFGASYILPSVFGLLSATHITHNEKYRNENYQTLMQDLYMFGTSQKNCIYKVLCSLVRKSSNAFIRGNPNDDDKFITKLINNEWLLETLENTELEEAIAVGSARKNCSLKYPKCKINPVTLQNFVNMLSKKFFGSN